jgi:hypothetical protein
MAESQECPATELFTGSSNQSFQNPKFTTVGHDIHNITVNIQASSTADRSQKWGRFLQQVFEFFHSPENRAALVHPNSEPALSSTSAMAGAHRSIEYPESQQDIQENITPGSVAEGTNQGTPSSGSSERSPNHGYQVVCVHLIFNRLDF